MEFIITGAVPVEAMPHGTSMRTTDRLDTPGKCTIFVPEGCVVTVVAGNTVMVESQIEYIRRTAAQENIPTDDQRGYRGGS